MLPFLTYPLALIGLVSLPALAAIYLLRNKFRRKTVSSLMLWQLQERSKEGGVKVQRMQLPLIFFLELLILALLVTAATGPRWQMALNSRPLVVVLDDSASMLAAQKVGTPRDQAIEAVHDLVRRQRFLNIRFVLAGARPSLFRETLEATGDVTGALERWRCESASSSVENAIAFAREISREDAHVLVVTDEEPPETLREATRLQWWSFGQQEPNFAFVNAARSVAEDKDRCLLEIANFSSREGETQLTISAGEKLIRQSTIELGTNDSTRVILNVPRETPGLKAELSVDGLAADNSVYLLPPLRERIRVQNSIEDEELGDLIGRALDATGLRSSISAAPHIVFHDEPGNPGGTNTWSVQFLVHDDAKSLTGPFVVDGSHPVANGLSLSGTVWAAGTRTNSAGYLPLITGGQDVLIAVRQDLFGRERLLINLNPKLSRIHQSPSWPILFWNILEWRKSALPGLDDVNFRPGTEVRIKTAGDRITLTRPGREPKELNVGDRELIARTESAGLYQVKADEGEWRFAVNFLAADESDLRPARSGRWGKWETDNEARHQYASVLWLFVLFGLLGIAGHHYLITHGKSRV